MTAILLFKGDQALHAAPSEVIPYFDVLAKDNVLATPKQSQARDKLGKAIMQIVAAKAFMEAAANRDGSEEDDADMVESMAEANHEEIKLTFEIHTTQAKIECRAFTLNDRNTWVRYLQNVRGGSYVENEMTDQATR